MEVVPARTVRFLSRVGSQGECCRMWSGRRATLVAHGGVRYFNSSLYCSLLVSSPICKCLLGVGESLIVGGEGARTISHAALRGKMGVAVRASFWDRVFEHIRDIEMFSVLRITKPQC